MEYFRISERCIILEISTKQHFLNMPCLCKVQIRNYLVVYSTPLNIVKFVLAHIGSERVILKRCAFSKK